MTLDTEQSVTGAKTFDKDKILMKGTSTGKTTISTANTSATDYTATLPAKNGTLAMTDDISTTTVFADNVFAIQDNSDATKQLVYSIGGGTT